MRVPAGTSTIVKSLGSWSSHSDCHVPAGTRTNDQLAKCSEGLHPQTLCNNSHSLKFANIIILGGSCVQKIIENLVQLDVPLHVTSAMDTRTAFLEVSIPSYVLMLTLDTHRPIGISIVRSISAIYALWTICRQQAHVLSGTIRLQVALLEFWYANQNLLVRPTCV
jgi:hypothetical protein